MERPKRDPSTKPFTGDMWETATCWLYRWFDTDGALLYVGVTLDPEQRERHHRNTWWRRWADRCEWEQEGYPRPQAMAREAVVVAQERPIFNRGMSHEIEQRQRDYIATRGEDPDAHAKHFPRKVYRRGQVARAVAMSSETWEQLDHLAAARGIDRSAWIEEAVRAALGRDA